MNGAIIPNQKIKYASYTLPSEITIGSGGYVVFGNVSDFGITNDKVFLSANFKNVGLVGIDGGVTLTLPYVNNGNVYIFGKSGGRISADTTVILTYLE